MVKLKISRMRLWCCMMKGGVVGLYRGCSRVSGDVIQRLGGLG
jgi:hypothetical protein